MHRGPSRQQSREPHSPQPLSLPLSRPEHNPRFPLSSPPPPTPAARPGLPPPPASQTLAASLPPRGRAVSSSADPVRGGLGSKKEGAAEAGMDGPKRQLRVRLRVTARRRGLSGDGADGGGAGAGAGGRKRRLDAPALNSAAKLQRREIGGRQLAARGGGPAAAVPERFRNMRLQVVPPSSAALRPSLAALCAGEACGSWAWALANLGFWSASATRWVQLEEILRYFGMGFSSRGFQLCKAGNFGSWRRRVWS